MTGIVVTRNPYFASFDASLRARFSRGASALFPKTWTRVLMIADPDEKTLMFTKNNDSSIVVYRWKRGPGVRISAGKFAFDLLGINPKDAVSHRFAVTKDTPEGSSELRITIHLGRKIR